MNVLPSLLAKIKYGLHIFQEGTWIYCSNIGKLHFKEAMVIVYTKQQALIIDFNP